MNSGRMRADRISTGAWQRRGELEPLSAMREVLDHDQPRESAVASTATEG